VSMDIIDKLRCIEKGRPVAQEAAEDIRRLRAEITSLNSSWQATFEAAAFHQEEAKNLRAQLAASEARAERMAKALRSAISVIERDGDPWNVCDDFRAALAEGEAG
jgi:predicted  nucleic acid-binding Zn-ribbon protein